MTNNYNNVTFNDLGISPVAGLNMVSLAQLPDYLGVSKKTICKTREKWGKELFALGMKQYFAKELADVVPGWKKISSRKCLLPLADGGATDAAFGGNLYYTAPALAFLKDHLPVSRQKTGAAKAPLADYAEAPDADPASTGMRVFNNPEFGRVRTVEINGKPWLVGKDVAAALGYAKPENALSAHVDPEDKTTTLIQGTGSNYKTKATIINKSGLYSLVLSSKLPGAKRFKHWVTSEVLVSIEETGGYIAGQETMSDFDLLAKALLVAQRRIESREAELAVVNAQNSAMRNQIELDRPKVQFAEDVSTSGKSMTIGDYAKVLYDENGIRIGRNRLFEWLRNVGILQQNNVPYQRYMEAGYFEVAEFLKNGRPVMVTYITGKGQLYVHRKLRESYAC